MLGRTLRCGALHQAPAQSSARPVLLPFHAVHNPIPLLSRTSQRRSVAACANRGPSFSNGKFGFEKVDDRWKVKLDSSNFEVADKDLMNILPIALLGFGGLALVFGPILFSIAIAAGAIGFALTVATTFLPVIIFMIGGGIFTSMMFMGFGFAMPLLVAGGIATVGGFALTTIAKGFLSSNSNKSTSSSQSSSRSTFAEEPKEDPDAEEKRLKQELKEFDQMLANRERKRKAEEWNRTNNTK